MLQTNPERYGETVVRRWMTQYEEVEADPEGIPAHYILQALLEANVAFGVPDWIREKLREWAKMRYGDTPLWRVCAFTGEIHPPAGDRVGWTIWHWKHRKRERQPWGCQLPLF